MKGIQIFFFHSTFRLACLVQASPPVNLHDHKRYRNNVTDSWSRSTGFSKTLWAPRSHSRLDKAGVITWLRMTTGSMGAKCFISSRVLAFPIWARSKSQSNRTKSTRRRLITCRTSDAEAAGTATQFNCPTTLHTKERLSTFASATTTTRDFGLCTRGAIAQLFFLLRASKQSPLSQMALMPHRSKGPLALQTAC